MLTLFWDVLQVDVVLNRFFVEHTSWYFHLYVTLSLRCGPAWKEVII